MKKHEFIKKVVKLMTENLNEELECFSTMGDNVVCFEKNSKIFYEMDITKFRAFCGGQTELEK